MCLQDVYSRVLQALQREMGLVENVVEQFVWLPGADEPKWYGLARARYSSCAASSCAASSC